MNDLFRKQAVEKTTTIEKTDELVKIITPPGWLILLGIVIIILVAFSWSLIGSISTSLSGQGIILKKGGVFNIVSNGTGQIVEILTVKNEFVDEGQIIARIDQPELAEKIRLAKNQLDDARGEFEKAKLDTDLRTQIKKKYIQSQLEAANQKLTNYKRRAEYLKEQLAGRKDLYDKGLITNEQVETTRQELNKNLVDIESTEALQIQYDYDLVEVQNQTDLLLQKSENRILETSQSLAILKAQHKIKSEVRSSFAGTILDINVYIGSTITQGNAVASIEADQQEIQAIIFLSPFEGKKVKEHMKAQIVPTNVKKEEYGFMIGEVSDVSKFPLSNQSLKTIIDNEGVINLFNQSGPPITVVVSFKKGDRNQYLWSSKKGESVEVTPGTLCYASISIDEQKPISLIFPFLKTIYED